MLRYRTHSKTDSGDGYDSEYESDTGTIYHPVKPIGQGHYAQARLFKSITNQAIAVLNPNKIPGDIGEAKIKQRFFRVVYPEKQSPLFIMKNDYRLVLPYISYVPYEKLSINTPEFQKILFRSAALALKDCHDKGIVVVDLKSDNIYYDAETEKSYLIDGGLSTPMRSPIDPLAFQKSSKQQVDDYKREYSHIPPECWSVAPNKVVATPAMDVYCLGILMQDLLTIPDQSIQLLIDSCLKNDPKERPTLFSLISSLEDYKLSLSIGKI